MANQTGTNHGFVFLVSLVATLGGFLFGFDSGVINGTVDGLQVAFNSSSFGTGFSVASMLLGSAVGALFAGRAADLFGRRSMLIVAAVLFIISAWGSGIANTSMVFVIYRFIGGIAVGAASVMAPAYISEIAPANLRGRFSSIQQIAIVLGLTGAFLSNYFLAQFSGSSLEKMSLIGITAETWRWMFWIELIPAGLFLVLLFGIPESPRFLVVKGARDKARAVLEKINPSSAAGKVEEIAASLAKDHRPRFADLFTGGRVRPIVWVGIGLATFQQLVGINVVFYYGAVLWQSVGFTEADALKINVVSGSVSILATFITLMTIDRIGRKPYLVMGSVGMAITLALVAYAFSTGGLVDGKLQLSPDMGKLALVSANVYVFLFNMSWGPVMWVMLGEMFPNQIRGSGLAIAGLFQWLSNFAITMMFPVMLAGIGLAASYGIYAFFAALSVFFVLYMVRETKGRELEDMEG